MTDNLRKHLQGLSLRMKELNGKASAPTQYEGLDAVFEAAQHQSAEDLAKMALLMGRARRGDGDAVAELCELRMETVDLYVRATSQFASLFFETVTLKDNEQFCVEHSYRNPTSVRYVGQDGGGRTHKLVKARKQTFVDVRELMSEPVGYQMRDIQQGADVAAAAQATVDTGWDLTNKTDADAFNLMNGGTVNGVNWGTGVYGPFTTTGAKLNRTWVPNPRINPANLPTTNDLVLADNGTSTGQSNLFRFSAFEAIVNYCDSFANIFGAPLRPTGMVLIPSSESTALAKQIVPTGLFFNEVAAGVLAQYTKTSYLGVNWLLVPDVTLPKGICYPVLSRPVGKRLVKPSMDQEFVESQPRKNWEERSASKVQALAFFEPDRVNALRLQYSSTYTPLTANE